MTLYSLKFLDSSQRIIEWAKANGVIVYPIPFSNKSQMSLTKEQKAKFFRDFAGSENTLSDHKVDLLPGESKVVRQS